MVDPYCLRVHGRDLYLLGHCHLRQEPRVFRVDRIAAAEPLDEEYRLPAGFDPEGFLATSLGVFLGEPGEAVVRFDGVAARFVAEHPLHPYRGDVEILLTVQRYGQGAEVLGPPELRDRARAEVEAMRARYRGPDEE
ncbi:MAG: WYL domain-containing protein [Deltaproteobacteria bacterium]|nr:WYL domain-containing protein [Deltaproteobacteria bacterium]